MTTVLVDSPASHSSSSADKLISPAASTPQPVAFPAKPSLKTVTAAPAVWSAPSSATLRESSADIYSDDDDDELSDGEITRLLHEAEDRMKHGSSMALTTSTQNSTAIRLPRLNPGAALPKPPIALKGAISRAEPPPSQTLADGDLVVSNTTDTSSGKKSKKEGPPPTAGAKWFDMPRTDLSSSTIKRDMEIIKARNVLDPHRHYKKDTSALPEYSQIGTIIEGNTEFHSSRIVRKDRKKTIVEEILADGTSRDRFKRKYGEIQKGKKSGKKEHYKKLMEQRKKVKYAK